MRNILSRGHVEKPFSFISPATWGKETKGFGVLVLDEDNMTIEVRLLKGGDADLYELIDFLLFDKDVRRLVKKYQQIGRKRPYATRTREGMSGCKDFFINFVDEETSLVVGGKRLLHASCFNKVEGIGRMYIGDFAELCYEVMHSTDFLKCPCYSSCRYVKPHKAEWTTEPHRIYA